MQTTNRGLLAVHVTTGYFWVEKHPRKRVFSGVKKV